MADNDINVNMEAAPFILASASPRRLELLEQIGIMPDETIPANIDETRLKDERPRQLVERLAAAKARHVARPGAFILGADTTVAVGRRILEKPQDKSEAEEFLNLLSGRRHDVIGGIALITPGDKLISRVVRTIVHVKRLSKSEISEYVSSEDWRGKAGGYGIQGRFIQHITTLQGSYTNVVGLCLHTTRQLLTGNGYLPPIEADHSALS